MLNVGLCNLLVGLSYHWTCFVTKLKAYCCYQSFSLHWSITITILLGNVMNDYNSSMY